MAEKRNLMLIRLAYIHLPVYLIIIERFEVFFFNKCIDKRINSGQWILIHVAHLFKLSVIDAEAKLTIFLWYKEY